MTTSVTLRIGVGEGVWFPNATLEEWSVANYTTPTYNAFHSNGWTPNLISYCSKRFPLILCSILDSNQWPHGHESCALPTELTEQISPTEAAVGTVYVLGRTSLSISDSSIEMKVQFHPLPLSSDFNVYYSLHWGLELVDGFEPPTYWLQISCATDCAIPAYIVRPSRRYVG